LSKAFYRRMKFLRMEKIVPQLLSVHPDLDT
jgi:hypothetical protein